MARLERFAVDPELRKQLDEVLQSGSKERGVNGEVSRLLGDRSEAGLRAEDVGVRSTEEESELQKYLTECAEAEERREVRSLAGLEFEAQEVALADDLLDALLGSPGDFVKVRLEETSVDVPPAHAFTFELDKRCGVSDPLGEIANQILKSANHYVHLLLFLRECESLGCGLLLQSLGAALRNLSSEYVNLVCQLEGALQEGRLSLQRMLYVLRPMDKSLTTLSRVVQGLGSRMGTTAFIALEGLWKSADDEEREIIGFLLSGSVASIFAYISCWMGGGEIDDPHKEFFLEEKMDLKREGLNRDFNSSYWDNRYRTKPGNIPAFLQPHIEKILLAGKYVNVLQECGVGQKGQNDLSPLLESLRVFEYGSPRSEYDLTKYVSKAFENSSNALMEHLMKELDLLGRLQSIKRYFLLDQGDFFSQFLDAASEELGKVSTKSSLVKLSSLLELSIRISSSREASYKDDLTCSMQSTSIADQLLRIVNMTGSQADQLESSKGKDRELRAYEAFSIDYRVSWPLNLIISRKAITKYQLLFRHLFHCRYVESKLGSSWTLQQTLKSFNARPIFANSFVLFGRMLNFVQSYLSYMQMEVIEPASQNMRSRLSKEATSIDTVIFLHDDFLATCVKDCVLTNARILQMITNLLSVCLMFANYADRFTSSAVEECMSLQDEAESDGTKRSLSGDLRSIAWENRFHETVDKFRRNFDAHLHQLLEVLGAFSPADVEPHLASLRSYLDLSGFYTMK